MLLIDTNNSGDSKMFDLRMYYKQENEKVKDSYLKSIDLIEHILSEINQTKDDTKNNYYAYLKTISKLILKMYTLEKSLNDDYFKVKSFEELLKENNSYYEELLPENYDYSYANPKYCVEVFGEQYGQLLSWFYTLYRNYITYAFYHKQFKMEEYNQLFINVYNYIKNNRIEFEKLKEIFTKIMKKDASVDVYHQYKEQYDPEFKYYTSIIENSDLNDPKYLFRFGQYISENEIKASSFLANEISSNTLEQQAEAIIKAYYKGFVRDNKDVTKKSTIGFFPIIGLEKLYHIMIQGFKNHQNQLKTCFLGYRSTKANEQYEFDHKFDLALYLDENYKNKRINDYKEGLRKNKDILNEYSGIMYIEKFGDPQFSPETKPENLKLTKDQQNLYQQFNSEIFQLIDQFIPRAETSFCIVGFPTPKIGENFKAIFEETIKINMLDSTRYEEIQSHIVNTLDKAVKVHVKGKDSNKTDLIITLQPLKDPSTQTNFVNSGASVNIPCGEVFTAPQLKGTNGILHVSETYQSGLRYDNLVITFQDGYTIDYNCSNFEKDEENKKYIMENLLFPHESLPIGEFAIGTNTIAYIMARKYNIMNLLPILILEKTGPHFAIGDTCFSRREDGEVFDPITSKKVCSKDNEKSIQRKKDPIEAYTNKHEDIVLPFDDIECITAITNDNKRIDIIRNGRFVLEGTKELNRPLDDPRF